jgi:hypothetical protein
MGRLISFDRSPEGESRRDESKRLPGGVDLQLSDPRERESSKTPIVERVTVPHPNDDRRSSNS